MSARRGWFGLPGPAWAIVGASVPVHLCLALGTDLSPDEAYYLCAARLGRTIADHPPLTLWLLAASDGWTSAPLELRVRIWAVALSLVTGVAIVALARARGAGREGCTLAAWVGSWAILPTAGGFVTTPDAPLLPAIALALLVATRVEDGAPPGTADRAPPCGLGHVWPAAVAGLALLVGALSKVVALPVGALLAASSRRASPALRGALVVGPLLALPWILASLRFQIHHAYGPGALGGGSAVGAAGAVVAAVAAQAALWSPIVLAWGFRALRAAPLPDRAMVAGMSALVLGSALIRGVPPEPNWWAPAALVVIVAAAVKAGGASARARQVLLGTVLLPTAIAAAHTVRPFLPLPERADPTARLHGWSRAGAIPEPTGAPGVGTYGLAAERCVYREECKEIVLYFDEMNPHEGSRR